MAVGHCSRLQLLHCPNNAIADLEVSKSILLNDLNCFGNRLDMLKIANSLLPRPLDKKGVFIVRDAVERSLVQGVCSPKNWEVFLNPVRSAYALDMGTGRAQPFRDKVLK